MAEGGYDTASYIQSIVEPGGVYNSGLVTKYGTPSYWIRYFSPSPNGTVNGSSTNANAEVRAAWDTGARYFSPISSPLNLYKGGPEGLAAAQAFVSAMIAVYDWVIPLGLPTNLELYCWLDQEQTMSMTTDYWRAWETYVNDYSFGGGLPFYACLYCNPPAPYANCSTIGSVGGCWAVWSSVPESPYCGYTLKNLPPWNAAGCAPPAPATKLWQFAEKGVCNLSYNVDMDEGTITPYSFRIVYRP